MTENQEPDFVVSPASAGDKTKSGSSWGVWPGFADLSRGKTAKASQMPRPVSSAGGPAPTGNAANPRRDAWTPFFRKVLSGRGNLGRSVCRVSYQKKDRILFTWKPPALPTFADFKEASGASAWDKLALNVLLLSDVPWWMTDCDIRDAGSCYGQLRAVRIIGDPLSGLSTGLCLVEFTDSNAVVKAFEDNGAGWQAREEEKSEKDRKIKVYHITGSLVRQLHNFTEAAAEEQSAVHWSLGTYFDEDTIRALYAAANQEVPAAFKNVEPSSKIDIPNKRTEAPEAPAGFQFPFAACAVVAASLRDSLAKKRQTDVTATQSGGKRARTALNSPLLSSDVLSGSSVIEEQCEDDLVSVLEQARVPYWGAALYPPVRLPPVLPDKQRLDMLPLRGGPYYRGGPPPSSVPTDPYYHDVPDPAAYHHTPSAYNVPPPTPPVWYRAPSHVPLGAPPPAYGCPPPDVSVLPPY